MTTRTRASLYDRIGGEEAIEALIVVFYRRVFADPELSPFFEGVPRDRLQAMQHEFFSAALDGPIATAADPFARCMPDAGSSSATSRASWIT